jgi:hypothetical protein
MMRGSVKHYYVKHVTVNVYDKSEMFGKRNEMLVRTRNNNTKVLGPIVKLFK